MTMFAVAIMPLIKAVQIENKLQEWFADDAASGGYLRCLRKWWSLLVSVGPKFGYFPNAQKTLLLTKPEKLAEAQEVFKDSAVNITEGKRYLGGALDTEAFSNTLSQTQVAQWIVEVECLARFSKTQPQAALAVFTHGLTSKWTHAFRVAAVLSRQHLVGLEKVIYEKLIPALTNQPTQTQDVRNLLALPARLGGMGITNPIRACKEQREMSLAVTKPLVERIRKQRGDMRQCQLEMDTVKRQLRRRNESH